MEVKRRKYCPVYCGSNRDSFDRFGDDLCEVILEYLTFEDKIRLECVAKQWRRYVYCRQYVLHVREHKLDDAINGLPSNKLLSFYDESITELKNVSIIERVLKKCPQINQITINWDFLWSYDFIKHDQLLRIIADNCVNLKAIAINDKIGESELKYLGEKCGKTLKTFTNNYYGLHARSFVSLMDYCPELVSIKRLNLSDLIDAKNKDKILAPKLREITDLHLEDRLHNRLMDTFANRYQNTLKVFEANFVGVECRSFMNSLSKLTNLEKLKLKMTMPDMPDNDLEHFTKFLTKIVANCVEIKYLSINTMNYNQKDVMAVSEFLNTVNSFAKLNYLYLNLQNSSLTGDSEEPNLSITLLKNCTQLKHITINCFIDSQFFADVDKYLPQLVSIDIGTTKCISDEMLNNLAKLENLRSICINSKCNAGITDTGICNLIDNCSTFRSFTFNPCPQHITGKTINKLIEIATNRPRINFIHTFKYSARNEIKMIESIVKKSGEYFTPNLKVQICFEKFPNYFSI